MVYFLDLSVLTESSIKLPIGLSQTIIFRPVEPVWPLVNSQAVVSFNIEQQLKYLKLNLQLYRKVLRISPEAMTPIQNFRCKTSLPVFATPNVEIYGNSQHIAVTSTVFNKSLSKR
uniref:Uncharacterized protein n=1 Tax=Glaukea argentea TaxID=2894057 RepID=A0A386B1K4_9CHLO|nr:hypothetical protein [Udotea argentea]AYC65591.1 hypothetical protein [Udotea argentea]